jgi:hypothetical protein
MVIRREYHNVKGHYRYERDKAENYLRHFNVLPVDIGRKHTEQENVAIAEKQQP